MTTRFVALIIIASCALAPSAVRAQYEGPERDAIVAATLDYIEGYFSGDAVRMERAVHPELHKIIVYPPREGMGSLVRSMGSSELIEITRSKRGAIPKEQWGITVTVLDVCGTSACVKATNPKFYDYLQLSKVDGQWKIMNVLWGFPQASEPK